MGALISNTSKNLSQKVLLIEAPSLYSFINILENIVQFKKKYNFLENNFEKIYFFQTVIRKTIHIKPSSSTSAHEYDEDEEEKQLRCGGWNFLNIFSNYFEIFQLC